MFRQAAGALLLILLSLTGVVWIALALKQLNLVTSEGQSAMMLFKMTTLAVPNLMVLIAPIALLIASFHTLNRLSGDSELIVLTAAGATTWTVGRPLVLLALVVSIAVSLTNHFLMPWSLREARDLSIQIRADLIGQVVQPGTFVSPEKDLTFHIRDRAFNGELLGLLMHDSRDPKQTVVYLAERGIVVKQDVGPFLVMYQGHILRKTDPKAPPQIIAFDTYAVDLDRFEAKGSAPELKPRERYFEELVRPGPDDEDFRRQPGHFRAELHERLSNPLYPFAFVLIALAFAGRALSVRQNRADAIVTGFLIAAGVRLAGLACNNLVVLDANAAPLLYLLPVISGALGYLGIVLGAKPRRGPVLRDRIMLPIEDLLARLARTGRGPITVTQAAAGTPRPRGPQQTPAAAG